jgi:hypothetical protein
MTRYHINPRTGNPGICRAHVACPYGDLEKDHFDSKEAAREAYEAGWPPEKLEGLKRAVDEVIDSNLISTEDEAFEEFNNDEPHFSGVGADWGDEEDLPVQDSNPLMESWERLRDNIDEEFLDENESKTLSESPWETMPSGAVIKRFGDLGFISRKPNGTYDAYTRLGYDPKVGPRNFPSEKAAAESLVFATNLDAAIDEYFENYEDDNSFSNMTSETTAEMDDYYENRPEVVIELDPTTEGNNYNVYANGKYVYNTTNRAIADVAQRAAKAGQWKEMQRLAKSGSYLTMARLLRENEESLQKEINDFEKEENSTGDNQALAERQLALKVKQFENEQKNIGKLLPDVEPPF